MSGSGKAFNTLPASGFAYWVRLAECINDNPVEERDRFFMAMLEPLPALPTSADALPIPIPADPLPVPALPLGAPGAAPEPVDVCSCFFLQPTEKSGAASDATRRSLKNVICFMRAE